MSYFRPCLFWSLAILFCNEGRPSAAQEAPTLTDIPVFWQLEEGLESPWYPQDDGANQTDLSAYRTDICLRQVQMRDGLIDLRHALQGLDLSVVITNYRGVPNEEKMFALSDDGSIPKDDEPGLFVVLLDELARRAGFQWRNSFRTVDPPPAGVSWTELLQWEVQHYDIAVDYWAKSSFRMSRGVSFPHGWYDGSIVMVTRQDVDDEPFDFWAFMVPFEWSVWLSVLVAIFVTGLLYFFMERLDTASDDRHLEDKPLTTIFLSSLTFCGHFEFQPNTVPSRLLSFSWGFWALVMVSAYTANLASFLVSESRITPTISTIEEALLTSTPLCVQRGSVIDDFLSQKYPELQLVRKATEQDMFSGLRLSWYGGGGGCGALLTNLGTFDVYRRQKATNDDCSLSSDKRVLINLPAGFASAVDSAVLCTSLVTYVLDVHLQEMRKDGFIEQAWSHHLSRIATKSCPDKALESMGDEDKLDFAMSLKDLGGIFLTHFFLSAIALIVALYQYLHTKYHEPERKLRPIDLSLRAVSSTLRLDSSLKGDNSVTSAPNSPAPKARSDEQPSPWARSSPRKGIPSFRWSEAPKGQRNANPAKFRWSSARGEDFQK